MKVIKLGASVAVHGTGLTGKIVDRHLEGPPWYLVLLDHIGKTKWMREGWLTEHCNRMDPSLIEDFEDRLKVYVASSWRNPQQPDVVAGLRAEGFAVYDFRNPHPGDQGFHWSEIDPRWQEWDVDGFIFGLEHAIACDGFRKDMSALKWCDVCVLLLPCGRSAHLEAGWAAGAGKRLVVMLEKIEPELMYKMAEQIIAPNREELACMLHEIWLENRL